MYISTKPTIYLIDGLNLVRSFLQQFAQSEEETTAEFLDFLEEMSGEPRYSMHTYEVIFDGSYRPVGPLVRGGVHISFSEGLSADEVIYERAGYLAQTNQRVIAVTDDRQLQESLKQQGIKVQFCRKFYTHFRPGDK